MNNNRKILCGAAALLVSAGFFGASFLIPELSDHINRLGNGNLLVYMECTSSGRTVKCR